MRPASCLRQDGGLDLVDLVHELTEIMISGWAMPDYFLANDADQFRG